MKKSIVWVIVVVVIVLVAGFYMMPNMQMKEESNEQSNSLTEQNVAGDVTQTGDTELSNSKVLNIVATESKATYEINELLRGVKTHVTGNSSELSGSVTLNPTTYAVEKAEIKLAANSFKTDIAARDGNVSKLIFKADQAGNEFITYSVSGIEGWPASVEMDKDYAVKVMGNMTISGVTKPVSFNGTAHVDTDGSFHVKAKTILTYGDFGLAIPNFPFLANVDKTADLSIELVAR